MLCYGLMDCIEHLAFAIRFSKGKCQGMNMKSLIYVLTYKWSTICSNFPKKGSLKASSVLLIAGFWLIVGVLQRSMRISLVD